MWYVMENEQLSYQLSDRLIRAINQWQISGTEDDVERLIEQGADVNRLHGTLLPLHCTCMVSDSYCLRLLLQHGARPNEVDGYGRTALHYAAERDIFCVEILLQHGADLNAQDSNQDTPLHWAAFKNNIACVKLLLQHGANVDARDFNSDTPLGWAARKGNFEVLKLLLDYNACPNIPNYHGDTPVSKAAGIQAAGLNNDLDDACLELLIKAAGQFDLRTNQGQLRNEIARDNRICDMLLPLCNSPRKLEELCRYSIRRSLDYRYLPNVIPKLPVPQRLKEYLSLQR